MDVIIIEEIAELYVQRERSTKQSQVQRCRADSEKGDGKKQTLSKKRRQPL